MKKISFYVFFQCRLRKSQQRKFRIVIPTFLILHTYLKLGESQCFCQSFLLADHHLPKKGRGTQNIQTARHTQDPRPLRTATPPTPKQPFLAPNRSTPKNIQMEEGKVIMWWLFLFFFPQATGSSHTLQGKFHLCIPFLGIARPLSQIPHSCVCEHFIYSQDRPTYFPAAE